jgi:HAD superfamily hydrolase (TIGR01549 family)
MKEQLPRGVIFDVDGTLVDTLEEHAAAWQQAFSAYGHNVSMTDIRGQFGRRNSETIETLAGPAASEAVRSGIDQNKIRAFRSRLHLLRPFDGAKSLIQRLARDRVLIGFASSAEPDDLQAFLTIIDVHDVQAARVSAIDIKHSKPDPESFDIIVRRWRVDPGRVVVIGDSIYDMQAAKAAGCVPIGVCTGGFDSTQLTHAGAARVYTSVLAIYEDYPLSISIGIP